VGAQAFIWPPAFARVTREKYEGDREKCEGDREKCEGDKKKSEGDSSEEVRG